MRFGATAVSPQGAQRGYRISPIGKAMFRTAPLDPGKAIRGIGREDLSILDFWRWGYSNLLPNITRGVFAEYLVAVALGKDGQPRKPWAGSDFKYKDKKVEVKSTSFVQSWGETRGEPVFVVAKHGEWSDRSELEKEKKYRGDVYVLCCLQEDADGDTIMDVSRWG